jgi:plastocyanin
MTLSRPLTRRELLSSASGVVVTGLAGCLHEATNASGDRARVREEGHDESHHGEEDVESEEGGRGHHGGELDEPSPEAEVQMTTGGSGSHFEPHIVWVEAGGAVTWHQESGEHSTTAYHTENDSPDRIPEEAASWDSDVLTEGGATFEQTFDVPGVYDYYCIPHEEGGMIGSVIVGEPEPDDQPGLEAPQETLPERARKRIESLNERAHGILGE